METPIRALRPRVDDCDDLDAAQTERSVNRQLMTDRQNQGARAPPVPVGQIAPGPNTNGQHSGAAAEVAAEAELQ